MVMLCGDFFIKYTMSLQLGVCLGGCLVRTSARYGSLIGLCCYVVYEDACVSASDLMCSISSKIA